MSILKLLKFYVGYGFYVMITVDERNNYLKAKEKGYNCTHSEDDSLFLYGSARVYHFDPSQPPTRDYFTYKQYRSIYYPEK